VLNDSSGVIIHAFGSADVLDSFVRRLRETGPPAAVIESLVAESIDPEPVDGFRIVESQSGSGREVSIPADLATCSDCVREIRNPADRRFRYPFTNCTNCGPRFTIALDVPYDRPQTSMSGFEMCPECRREYEDPADRRFHAQPNACPVCGPTLSALDAARAHRDVERLHQGRLGGRVDALLHLRRQHLHALLHRRAEHRGELRGKAGILQQHLGLAQVFEVLAGERHQAAACEVRASACL